MSVSPVLRAHQLLLSFVVCHCVAPLLPAADWPRWRGVGGSGVWEGVTLPARLTPSALEKKWSVPIGGGYSGIAVRGERLYTLERRGESERIVCLAASTGKPMWTRDYEAPYGDLDYGNGPRATPTVAGRHVYTLGAMGHLTCCDASSGTLVWQIDAKAALRAEMPMWGHAASPVVYDDLLIVSIGARPDGTLVAFERTSGKEKWRALADRPGYATPLLERIAGRLQVVLWTADAAVGIAPEDGRELWRFPFKTSNFDVAIATPVVQDSLLFLSGYWDGTRVVRLGGRAPELAWKNRRLSALMATPLCRDGHVYALDKRDGLVCVEWKSGNIVWKDHSVTPQGRNPHASMVWAGDRAVFLNTPGELVMAKLSPKGYEELGRVPIVGRTWAHPAFVGQLIFARSDTEVVCWQLQK